MIHPVGFPREELQLATPGVVNKLQTVVCSLNTHEVSMSQCAIAYYRVSTQRQGRSGLGLEAQRAAVSRFAESEGITIEAEFTEVETGKGADALDRRRNWAKRLKNGRCRLPGFGRPHSDGGSR